MTDEAKKSPERAKFDELKGKVVGAFHFREEGAELALRALLEEYERAIGQIEYARNVLRDHDVYGAESLDGMVREAVTVLRERGSRIDELLREASALENERRRWKNQAESWKGAAKAIFMMVAAYYGAEEGKRADDVRKLTERLNLLEKDAWCGAANLARDFIEQAESPLMDYAPDLVRPIDAETAAADGSARIDPKTAFIRRWVSRFRAVL